MKTLFFEKRYKVNIKDFSTTEDVDKFLEQELGKPLKVIRINTNIL